MNDLIRREDVIEAVRVCDVFLAYQGEKIANNIDGFVDSMVEQMRDNISRAVSALPSAEAVHGEWEHWGSPFSDESEVIDTIVCSVCGARFIEPKDEPKGEYNFCPNCGARMKGGAE